MHTSLALFGKCIISNASLYSKGAYAFIAAYFLGSHPREGREEGRTLRYRDIDTSRHQCILQYYLLCSYRVAEFIVHARQCAQVS